MRRNLVTGGSGFLGTYLVWELLRNNEEVVVFDSLVKPPDTATGIMKKAEYFSGDVSNLVNVLEAVKKYDIDCIYHCAALRTITSEADPFRAFQVNVEGVVNVLEVSRILGVKDVIMISSGASYGAERPPAMIYDDTLQQPDNMYGVTKVCDERLGEQYHRQYGVNFRALRFPVVVGPGRQIAYYFGDWSGVIEIPARGKPYTVHSNPQDHCHYMYVKDAIQAMLSIREAPEKRLRHRVYNAGGFLASISEVTEAVKRVIPDAQITFDVDNGEKMRSLNRGVNYEMDNTSAFEDFGYQPRYLLDEMVEDFIQEVRRGRPAKMD